MLQIMKSRQRTRGRNKDCVHMTEIKKEIKCEKKSNENDGERNAVLQD